ncbi:hypothetical protein QZH41_003948 [Actinostola sp. cb2023]|nr:hypothetical protein QZH41_003948 [Actinostola sp. cb2023]
MVAHAIAYAILLCTALVGNLLVVLVIQQNKKMRTTVNYFIFNMSLSDLIIPTVVIPFKLFSITTGSLAWTVHGALGEFLCKFFYFVSDITPPVSILSLVFMTVDRFYAVVYPMKAALIPRGYRIVVIILTWIISMAVFSPYFYGLGLYKMGTQWYCIPTWSESSHKVFSTTVCIIFIIVPFTVLTVLYTAILVTLRRSRGAGEELEVQKQRRAKRNVAVIKLAFTIVVAFAVCWGPYNTVVFIQIFSLLDFQARPELLCSWPSVQAVAQFLAYANTAINPLIYFILNENYRQGLKRAVTKTIYGRRQAWLEMTGAPQSAYRGGGSERKISGRSRNS